MSRPTNERIKYLNRYACKKNLVITAAAEAANGTIPTWNMSCGETRNIRKVIMKGMMLTGTATIRQFKASAGKPTLHKCVKQI
jgi:hypothetical protein